MAQLIYYCGTMDSGKSTLALQTAHNHNSRGRDGILFTNRDRAGSGKISSRLGLTSEAIEVSEDMDLHKFVVEQLSAGKRIDFVICDEAQFYTSEQIEQLARVADGLGIDVFAFGILTDFRTRLFPGSARLVELADRVSNLQVEALCWCGERATHNARTVGGVMVTEGEQVVVGDTNSQDAIAYEVLCRRHHMRKVTAKSSGAAHQSSEPLPFN
ncbi:MAG: thymidine kinase [Actinobacteria bacterium]|jgi:thymidine kinase|nr:thymidine kinase [Actinomycetota bacterium]NCW34687.1 thymidine kinase [Actinomycetota bacterium]NCZ73748.1 thymidine kinase [Actinomycetota bacterium]NDA41517.1 thymidine kinase [Actinomycetota bacterium]NDB30973.1 thymidine kinase [Actinomycetota bacterium]